MLKFLWVCVTGYADVVFVRVSLKLRTKFEACVLLDQIVCWLLLQRPLNTCAWADTHSRHQMQTERQLE